MLSHYGAKHLNGNTVPWTAVRRGVIPKRPCFALVPAPNLRAEVTFRCQAAAARRPEDSAPASLPRPYRGQSNAT